MAKSNVTEFFRQVRAEAEKIVWPSGSETMRTAILVVLMTSILAVFFFAIDNLFGWIVRALLGLAAG